MTSFAKTAPLAARNAPPTASGAAVRPPAGGTGRAPSMGNRAAAGGDIAREEQR